MIAVREAAGSSNHQGSDVASSRIQRHPSAIQRRVRAGPLGRSVGPYGLSRCPRPCSETLQRQFEERSTRHALDRRSFLVFVTDQAASSSCS